MAPPHTELEGKGDDEGEILDQSWDSVEDLIRDTCPSILPRFLALKYKYEYADGQVSVVSKQPKAPKELNGYPGLGTLGLHEGFLVEGDPTYLASNVQAHASLMGKFWKRKFKTKTMRTMPQRGIFIERTL